jgi:transcriptional regulator with XRE-family HTH domain
MGKKKANTRQIKNSDKELAVIGKRLRELRKAKGFTNAEFFAYENEFSSAQYARYERGEDLRVSTLIRLTKGLGISLKEFFSEGFD